MYINKHVYQRIKLFLTRNLTGLPRLALAHADQYTLVKLNKGNKDYYHEK